MQKLKAGAFDLNNKLKSSYLAISTEKQSLMITA